MSVAAVTLSPALAAAKARGVSRRACAPPPRPPRTPVPAAVTAVQLCALLDAAARERGTAHGVDFRRYSSCRALLAALHAQVRQCSRGRPASGTVRNSWPGLARLVDGLLDWERGDDRYADGDRRRSSLRRWMRELEACGLLRSTIVYDDEGQERGVDVELLEIPAIDTDALEYAAGRLQRWRRRYGNGPQLAERRSGAILARLAQRRSTAQRHQGRTRSPLNTSGPPLRAPTAKRSSSSSRSDPCKASCGARPRDLWSRDPTASASTSGHDASSGATAGTEDAGREALLRDRWAAWERQIARADASCAAHTATSHQPLPELGVLRTALAGRLQGVVALAADEPIAGLGPVLALRLQRAATSWMRWRPVEAPDPAGELIRRADTHDGELGELVRGFAVAAKRQARSQRSQRPERLDAAHRRAQRQRDEILDAWPAWLKHHGDRLLLDPGDRFVQVHTIPAPAELASPQLRRWLRAITALDWHQPASAIELTDPDGRYAYIPLDAGRLDAGERTRGPWTNNTPRLQLAFEQARRIIQARRR